MNITFENLQDAVYTKDLRITISDAREYFGGCVPGWQAFAATHNFDWKETIRHGVLASKLLETEDVMALNLITFVYLREEVL